MYSALFSNSIDDLVTTTYASLPMTWWPEKKLIETNFFSDLKNNRFSTLLNSKGIISYVLDRNTLTNTDIIMKV